MKKIEREFILTEEFDNQLADFRDPDGTLRSIEQEVLKDLEKLISKRDVISGTGGFTKLRVGSGGKGKSGGKRVIYLDCPTPKRTFLMMIYSHSDMDNISPEGKKALREIAKELKSWQPKKEKK